MSAFEKALAFTLGNEGGYANDPDDRGGATNLGITQGTLAAAYRDGIVAHNDVKRLTRDEAAEIYRARYWLAAKCDRMPEPLCVLHFDAAVNHGTGGAGRLLQRALNSFGAGLVVDGAVGEKTLAALGHVVDGMGCLHALCEAYCDEREKYYRAIVAGNPSQKKFLNGWLNRLKRNRELL